MNISRYLGSVLIVGLLVGTPAAQAPPAQRRVRPRPATPTPTVLVVRDVSGSPIAGVHVAVGGPDRREIVTDQGGTASVMLSEGQRRLRFEREGFITLERDVTVRNGQPAELAVVLDAAPAPPPPPPPPPTPAPAAPPPPDDSARAATVSIPAFIDKNFIGRDPLKESILGCTAAATTRLLQLRDPLAQHAHADSDEIVYVVAGDGAIRIRNESTVVGAGSLTVIPRGAPHAIERRGKNPLIVVSTLAGAPCRAAAATQRATR